MCDDKCIEESVKEFLSERALKKRYASFDYCYNYFYSSYKNDELGKLASKDNIQMSCFQLGFYLASWGMLRGSSKILQKSVKYFEPLIEWISNADKTLWKIDVSYDKIDVNSGKIDVYSYNDLEVQDKLMEAAQGIREALKNNDNSFNPSKTLVTKVMLGVFGNTPALDTYFSNSFGVRTLNNRGLTRIYDFYSQHKEVIDGFEIYTLDFTTGKETNIKYKKAKIIDMVGFVQGLKGNSVF